MDIQDPGKSGKKSDDNKQQPKSMMIFLFIGVALTVFLLLSDSSLLQKSKEMQFSELLSSLKDVKSLTIENETGVIYGELRSSGQDASVPLKFTVKGEKETNKQLLEKLDKFPDIKWQYQEPPVLSRIIKALWPFLFIGLIFYFLIFRQMKGPGGGGILSFGKSRAMRITRDNNTKTFEDVAGIDEAKEEVGEIIEFLRTPEKFERLGGRLPKGVLLVGAPGTGKTLLAKAIAGEADVPFFSISGSDFVEMFVGVGASRVRDLFEQAKEASPCIIFLDEIDAVGRKRAHEMPGGGQETAQTLNAILVEMDGFQSDDKVIVMAATNRPDVLDPALLRPGRFDRRVTVDLPDIKGREEILKVHVKGVKLSEEVDLSVVARGTPTFCGAELENVVNEAALIAVMRNKDSVDGECFEEARDKVRWGREKRSRKMDEQDRRDTAFHEAGHAMLMLDLPHATPLHKVTIIPRGRALGATMQLPEKDEYSMSRRKIVGEITVLLGGRVAEELYLDDVTTGASNDFERASHLARAMVCEWGMSEKLGVLHYSDRGQMAGGFFEGREFSESTAELIDKEVRTIIDGCYEEAKTRLSESKDKINLLVEALMEFEVLSRGEVDTVLEEMSLVSLRSSRKVKLDKAESDRIKVESEEATEKETDSPDKSSDKDFNSKAERDGPKEK